MTRSFKIFMIACGLLMLAAVPVLAQADDPVYEVKFNKDAVAEYADFLIEKLERDKVDLSQRAGNDRQESGQIQDQETK